MKKLETTIDRIDILIPEDYNQPISIDFENPLPLYEDEGKTIVAFGMPKEHFDLFCVNYEQNLQQGQN